MEAEKRVVPTRSGRLAGVGLRTSSGGGKGSARRRRANAIPDEILHDAELNADVANNLPANYSFEIHKTIWRVRKAGAKCVALQMPEGLLRYSCVISDILRKHADARTVVLGDVTYGACCVDDYSAVSLGCDFLVHYGHSCLVPVSKCLLPMMYVFVHIAFDPSHLVRCLKDNFEATHKIALTGTIQFIDTVHKIMPDLQDYFHDIHIPQVKPLSRGELLGCTSPKIAGRDALIYVGDGRFHLESAMISNPTLPAYRYDPYSKTMSVEAYDHSLMRKIRRNAIATAREARMFAIILGTLGRQGSPGILRRLETALSERGKVYCVVLLSEITAHKLLKLEDSGIEAWIQIACPRLSIDWGTNYGQKPLLTPYEAFVALGLVPWREEEYPMDFYAKDSGPWTNYYKRTEDEKLKDAPSRTSNSSTSCCQNKKPPPPLISASIDTSSTTPTENRVAACESSQAQSPGGCCSKR